MEFKTIKYTGTKDYRDRTVLRNLWCPGDVKPVPERDAKKLLQFAEFKPYEGKATKELKETQEIAQQIVKDKQDKDKRQLENVQFSIDQMDKGALEAYAKQYGVDLDKRRSVETLRQDVNNLIELHGALR